MQYQYLQSDIEEIINNLGEITKSFNGKTILITGGCGFLGRYMVGLFSYLNNKYLENPCHLIVLDNFITAGESGTIFSNSKLLGYNFIKHNVIEPFIFDSEIHFIIHAASIASPFYYREYPLETLDAGVTGTRNMLEMAKAKHARILFFSSSEIYGDPDPKHVPIPESYRGNVSCLGSRSCYDESKRLGETLCYIYHEYFGVETVIVRPFNVYGPGMQERDYRVLPNFANRIKGSHPLNIYGTGHQTRTFCYITDALTGFILTLLKGIHGEPYNIGNPTPEISMFELAKLIERIIQKPLTINTIEYPDSYPPDEPMRRCPDIRKAKIQLGYEPKVSLEEGLRRFLKWTNKVYNGRL